MANLIKKTGLGFTKEQAAVNAGVDMASVKYDSTQAYKKLSCEDGFNFDTFAADQIKTRAKDVANVGFSITVKAGKEDSRERPYKEEVVITTQPRKYTTTYVLVTGLAKEATSLVGGTIVGSAGDKADARKAAKDFIIENKVDVKILPIKVVTEGEAVAANVVYTPSLGATMGEYIFFTKEA